MRGERLEARTIRKPLRVKTPQIDKSRIAESEASISPKHRDALAQGLQRLALRAIQRIETRLQLIGFGRIIIEIGDAALRIGMRDHIKNATIR